MPTGRKQAMTFWKMEPDTLKATEVGQTLSTYSEWPQMYTVVKKHPRKGGVTVRAA